MNYQSVIREEELKKRVATAHFGKYDDFGRTISQSGPMAEDFRHRFSTKYFDAETGLYYYGYRFYSPSLMRWLNRDPIDKGGLNLYGFCGNCVVANYDKGGCAYFAYRLLDNPITRRTGIIAMASVFMKQPNNQTIKQQNRLPSCLRDRFAVAPAAHPRPNA